MRLVRHACLILALGAAPGGLAAQIPDSFTNLKVLPRTITRSELLETMKGFALGLGVRCTYCHVGEEGRPLSTFDFASDEKPPKHIARVMLRMVQAVNTDWIPQLDTIAHTHTGVAHDHAARVRVQCATCHRGVSRPVMIQDLLARVIADSGIEAAVARYRALKAEYYGTFAYDFSQMPLLLLAESLDRQNNVEAAVRLLQLNIETNPESWLSWQALGNTYAAQGRQEDAKAAWQKSLEINPRNEQLRRRMER